MRVGLGRQGARAELTQGSVHVVWLHRAHGGHGALGARAQRELRAQGDVGLGPANPASPPGQARTPLTLALAAPGPMGFSTAYMLSLDVVESAGTAQARRGRGPDHRPPRPPARPPRPYLQGWA
jgi:hypothetical protein